LERLEYLESVDVETPAIAGAIDQVDVNFNVTERPSGNLLFGVGYGQDTGILVNASINQNNFLGTGNQFSLMFNNSEANTIYSLFYNNPYYTINGISRGFRLFYRRTDPGQVNAADYTTDGQGAYVLFGFPLNEFDFLRVGLGYEGLKINTTASTPIEIRDYLTANGDDYQYWKLETSWARDRRNRTVFADRGSLNRIAVNAAMPGSDQEYYKLDFRHTSYFPLTKSLTFSLNGEVGYGDGYSNTEGLPFYENYYAGGLRSVRGYKTNTLGPRYSNGQPSGGSLKTVGSAELIFPVPLIRESKSVRLSAFFDAGNVFASTSDFAVGDLRYSTGVAAQWLSPLGPLAFSLGAALNAKDGDEKEAFQFSIGLPLF
jgi:outer membrane protein insertion porin family